MKNLKLMIACALLVVSAKAMSPLDQLLQDAAALSADVAKGPHVARQSAQDIVTEVARLRALITKHENDAKALQAQVTGLQTDKQQNAAQITQLNSQVNALTAQSSTLTTQVQNLTQANKALQTQASKQKQDNTQLKQENTQLKTEKANLNTQYQTEKQTLESVQAKLLQALKDSHATAQNLKQQLDDIEKTIQPAKKTP